MTREELIAAYLFIGFVGAVIAFGEDEMDARALAIILFWPIVALVKAAKGLREVLRG